MIESLVEIGISNSMVSIAIAIIAVVVGKYTNKSRLAYMLWLLVLVKLLMPSFIALPVLPNFSAIFPAEELGAVITSEIAELAEGEKLPPVEADSPSIFGLVQRYLPLVWGAGILFAFVWSSFRIYRFNRLLNLNSKPASEKILQSLSEISAKLNLKKPVVIKTTSAEISPMVWWLGGPIRIYLPSKLIEQLDDESLRLVLAHELAHVKRKDYLVRLLEWVATTIFWWNPTVWWAQQNLRAYEEVCCDELVLSTLKPKPHQYATSLLNAVESFAGSALRHPSLASKINSGGNFTRRINMILSKQHSSSVSRKVQFVVLLVAAMVLPIGLANAQEKAKESEVKTVNAKLKPAEKKKYKDPALEEEVTKIKKAIKAGEITLEQGRDRYYAFKMQRASTKMSDAVKAGKLSREQADKKLNAYKQSLAYEKVSSNLKSQVKAGKITKEEAREQMTAYRLNAARTKIKSMVEAGKLTDAEAEAKLIAVEKEIREGKPKVKKRTN